MKYLVLMLLTLVTACSKEESNKVLACATPFGMAETKLSQATISHKGNVTTVTLSLDKANIEVPFLNCVVIEEK